MLEKGRAVNGAKKVAQLYSLSAWQMHGWLWRTGLVGATLMVVCLGLMCWWSREPNTFAVEEVSTRHLTEDKAPVVGNVVVGTIIESIDVLLDKSGGYLSNDKASPAVLLDNMPAWEYGVLKALREMGLSMRLGFSRSQSQSATPKGLETAENHLRISSTAWYFPSAETEYRAARDLYYQYNQEIADENNASVQFYARADNLAAHLEQVSKSMGDLTQRLSASVGSVQVEYDAQGQLLAQNDAVKIEKTPWREIDDVFFEARGYTWAVLHQMKAIRRDFAEVLAHKNALVSLDQIITELRNTQRGIRSPVILNGSGFGFRANHSLVMGSYLSRANAAMIDLIQLLKNG